MILRAVAFSLLVATGCSPAKPSPPPAAGPAGAAGRAGAASPSARSVPPGTDVTGKTAAPAPPRSPLASPAAPPLTAPSSLPSSTSGLVVSVEPNATKAGVEMLAKGGNAVDAAVAVAFALAVTHPSAGNLGGGGFLLYRPRGGPTSVVEFREAAPAAVTEERFRAMLDADAVGPAAVATPGTVAGLDLALARFGRLQRADVVAPAIRLAREGYRLDRRRAKVIEWAWPALSRDPAARKVFGAHGKPRPEGSVLVQSELASTLERIRDAGDAGFYAGPVADAIAALAPRGGLVSLADLAAYRANVREPSSVSYRGYTVEVPPPPSAGGVGVLVELAFSDKLEAFRHPSMTVDAEHLFAEIARRAHATRRLEVGDPDSIPGFDLDARRARWLDVDAVLGKTPIDMAHATPSSAVDARFTEAVKELEHTTHFSVVDAAGGVVSCTTTLSASFGARTMAAGVVLNNAIAAFGTIGENRLAPRRRMTTSMSPTVVTRNGEAVLVVGSPGGDTIPNTIVRVIRNLIDHGMTLREAIDAPRLHHGFVPDEIRYESGRPPPRAVLDGLRKRGHRLSHKTTVMGAVDAIQLVQGAAYGYADPREGGLAEGPAVPRETGR